MKLRLPSQEVAFKTSEDDPIEYYYKPLIGVVYRKRLKMALRALGDDRFDHLLEIGYGSGVFLPTLSGRAKKISAFDLHTNVKLVRKMLSREQVEANLWAGDVLHISVPDGAFDAIVCLSVLEHLTKEKLDMALSEIARVSQPGARIVLGFPRRNMMTDLFYLFFGYNPRSIHPASHEDIEKATKRHLSPVRRFHFLPIFPSLFGVYTIYQCIRD